MTLLSLKIGYKKENWLTKKIALKKKIRNTSSILQYMIFFHDAQRLKKNYFFIKIKFKYNIKMIPPIIEITEKI